MFEIKNYFIHISNIVFEVFNELFNVCDQCCRRSTQLAHENYFHTGSPVSIDFFKLLLSFMISKGMRLCTSIEVVP